MIWAIGIKMVEKFVPKKLSPDLLGAPPDFKIIGLNHATKVKKTCKKVGFNLVVIAYVFKKKTIPRIGLLPPLYKTN